MNEIIADTVRVVGRAAAVPNDRVIPFYLEEFKARISVARVDDHLYAFDDICTCTDEGCPLSGGLLTGATITCQCHGSAFDIATGAVVNGPATDPLRTYEVQETADGIQIRT
jgi:3-phenylpropionate/trans-cinnamate dioxygenase ferredoxin subunit